VDANLFGPDLGYVFIILLVVVLFGSQLPKIARNVGTAGKEFRKAQQEAEEEAERDRNAKVTTPAPTAPPVPAGVGPGPISSEESFKLSRAELDALLRAREQDVRHEMGGSAS